MRWWSEVKTRLRAVVSRRTMERELEEELSFHLRKETEKNVGLGMTPQEARREAYRRFGGVDRHREAAREAWGTAWLEAAVRDMRLALRRMARAPGFTLAATLTLALGIGGTSATFAVVEALLLRPLPYPHDDRLVWVTSSAMITPANLGEWRAGFRAAESLAGFNLRSDILTGRGAARSAAYMAVSDECFPLLGAEPMPGRLWTPTEAAPGAPPVAVVSHRVWMEELSGGELAGRSVTVGGTSYAVIGVLPAGFHNLGFETDLWVPIPRAMGSLNIVARLRPDATVAMAQQEVDALIPRLTTTSASDRFSRDARVFGVRDQLVGDLREPLLALFGAASFVLLLACANVATLLFSAAAGRARELSLRSALGAGRAPLLRQLLVECAALALLGASGGVLVARWGIRTMVSLAPPWLGGDLMRQAHVGPPVLLFAVALAGGATLLAGMAPALRATRAIALTPRVTATPGERRWREALAASEVALAFVLVVGTALMVQTYLVLRPASPGFETRDRWVMALTLPGLRHLRSNMGPSPEDAASASLVRTLLHDVEAAAPGAEAEVTTFVPMSGMVRSVAVEGVDGRSLPPVQEGGPPLSLDLQASTPGFFRVMGMQMTRGRGLSDLDAAGAPGVVVLNEAAARQLWPDLENPVGRRVTVDPYGAILRRSGTDEGTSSAAARTVQLNVVGVVANSRSSGVETSPRATAFVSYWQMPWPLITVVIHTQHTGSVTADMLRAIVAATDPTVSVREITTLDAVVAEAVARPRFEATLMTVFGVLAVILAVIGCYGVMAYSVAQRTKEIGVRIALGATGASIARRILGRGVRVVGTGLAGGVLLAAAGTKVLESSLYGVSPTDPATFVAAAGALATVALFAAWLPARRAVALDPVRVLKEE